MTLAHVEKEVGFSFMIPADKAKTTVWKKIISNVNSVSV
jgi:hypothetical protein